jgi:hypothetical protein
MDKLNNNKSNKISRLHRCMCDWLHITQGPFSCWVCQETLSFAKWQTGKEAPVNPTKVVVHRNTDPRDRTKEQVVIRKDKIEQVEGPRELGWPDEAGVGRYSRDFINGNVDRERKGGVHGKGRRF